MQSLISWHWDLLRKPYNSHKSIYLTQIFEYKIGFWDIRDILFHMHLNWEAISLLDAC